MSLRTAQPIQKAVVRIPTALIAAVAVTIAGVITFALTGRIGAGVVALGVVWIMRVVRSQRSDPQG